MSQAPLRDPPFPCSLLLCRHSPAGGRAEQEQRVEALICQPNDASKGRQCKMGRGGEAGAGLCTLGGEERAVQLRCTTTIELVWVMGPEVIANQVAVEVGASFKALSCNNVFSTVRANATGSAAQSVPNPSILKQPVRGWPLWRREISSQWLHTVHAVPPSRPRSVIPSHAGPSLYP
jgi:hypothetical protein